MFVIKLNENYMIEVDPMNYILKKKYLVKAKSGEQKEVYKVDGYFGTVKDALERFIEHLQMDELDGMAVDISEYVRAIAIINKEAVKGLERVLGKI